MRTEDLNVPLDRRILLLETVMVLLSLSGRLFGFEATKKGHRDDDHTETECSMGTFDRDILLLFDALSQEI